MTKQDEATLTEAQRSCDHRQDTWPHNDSWKVIQCSADVDTLECRKCGRITTARCDFDENYN